MTAVSATERCTAPPLHRLLTSLGLLWLSGAALRMTVLAVPPLLPLIHGDIDLSETEIGTLAGLPSLLFAAAAVPGVNLYLQSLQDISVGARVDTGIGMATGAPAGAPVGGGIPGRRFFGMPCCATRCASRTCMAYERRV